MCDILRKEICVAVSGVMPKLHEISVKMYDNPETGGTEKFASALLADFMENEGFSVERDYFGQQYALRASYDSEKPGPTIGFFAEYDALPDIGHGCGHNLICTTSAAAAVGLKSVLSRIGGRVILYGTPGEENIQSKTLMAPKGAFDEADVCMMVHPHPSFTSVGGKTLAIESVKIEFHGKASHAGSAPEEGINALDAAVNFYNMVSSMKQYYPDTNVYGVILESGKKASVIPDYASLHYLLRAWDGETIDKLKKMVGDCASAAAIMTGCSHEISPIETNNAAMLSNAVLSDIFAKYLGEEGIKNIERSDVRGSTDMGDVSVRIPSIHPWVKLKCEGGVLHSREFAEASVSEDAGEFMIKSACAMALTAAEVISDSEILCRIKEEFKRR